MREFINKYGAATVGVLFVLVIVAFWFRSCRKEAFNQNPRMAFYIDEETGEESVAPINQHPPLMGKAGKPTVVLAVKCTLDGKTLQTLYLVKYSEQALQAIKTLPPREPNDPTLDPRGVILERGKLVRRPAQGSPWVPALSPEGAQIRELPKTASGEVASPVTP
jgi:hypothetical protein